MSYLFQRSSSIHGQFQALLRQAGGVAGIIDIESDDNEFLSLSVPHRSFYLDKRAYLDDDFDPDRGGTDYDVDGFAAAVLAQTNLILGGDDGDQGIATTEVL